MEINDIDFLSFLELDVENEINKNDSDDERVRAPQTRTQCTMCLKPYCSAHQTYICTTCHPKITSLVAQTEL